jgi:hypothetical protein
VLDQPGDVKGIVGLAHDPCLDLVVR